MLENDLKEFIKTSRESLQKVEKRMESMRKEMGEDVSTFWNKLNGEFEKMNGTLTNAAKKIQGETELQGKLAVMEARDQAEKIQSTSEEFLRKVTSNAQQELDVAVLQAHLAKMQAKDTWKEQEPKLTALYHESKGEFEKLSKAAGKELNDILLKLSEIV